MNGDAFGPDVLEHDRGQFRIILAQRLEALDDGDLGAQPAVRLSHLHADRATADDNEMPWRAGAFEQGFVGQVVDRVETGDRRHEGRGAGGDNIAPGADLGLAGHDGGLVDETGLGLDHVDAHGAEAFDGIIGGDGADDRMDVIMNLAEIDLGLARGDTEIRRFGDSVGVLCRRNHRLGRHAAVIETVAAHLALFDENHVNAERGGGGSDRKAARATADDADVRCQWGAHELSSV